jgi:putative transposase
METLADVIILRRPPAYVPSDNCPESIASALREWIAAVGSQGANIAPSSTGENSCDEAFNSKVRDELLDGEISFSLFEAQSRSKASRQNYNGARAHSSLNRRPPAPESLVSRSGSIVPWTSPSAIERASSPNPNTTLETTVRKH